MAAKKKVAG